jgi:hypothetical protein
VSLATSCTVARECGDDFRWVLVGLGLVHEGAHGDRASSDSKPLLVAAGAVLERHLDALRCAVGLLAQEGVGLLGLRDLVVGSRELVLGGLVSILLLLQEYQQLSCGKVGVFPHGAGEVLMSS